MQAQHLKMRPIAAVRRTKASGVHHVHGLLPCILPCTLDLHGDGFVGKQPIPRLLHKGVNAECGSVVERLSRTHCVNAR